MGGGVNIFPGYLTAGAQTRYVDKSGNDTTGNGTFGNPYLTVQAAINSIGDASSAKPYVVQVGPGIFATNFVLSPWIFVVGSGAQVTQLAPTPAQCLGAGFAGAAASTSGIFSATITTTLLANFSTIGSTGAGQIYLGELEWLDTVTLTGATVTNRFIVRDCFYPTLSGKNVTLASISGEMTNVVGAFGSLIITSTDAYATTLEVNACGAFGAYTQTWTGATTANALTVLVMGGWPFNTNQVTVTGLGATLQSINGSKLVVVAATPTEVQFSASFPGAGTVVNGCNEGMNEIISNLGTDSVLTLHRPGNGTFVSIKNQSAFVISLTYADGIAFAGCPSFIGPYGMLVGFFSSGTWMLQQLEQSGTAVPLVNGVSALIPADVSAKSSIVATLNTWNGASGTICAKVADRVNGTKGTGGGFILKSIDPATGAVVLTDQGTYDWHVFPGRA